MSAIIAALSYNFIYAIACFLGFLFAKKHRAASVMAFILAMVLEFSAVKSTLRSIKEGKVINVPIYLIIALAIIIFAVFLILSIKRAEKGAAEREKERERYEQAVAATKAEQDKEEAQTEETAAVESPELWYQPNDSQQ